MTVTYKWDHIHLRCKDTEAMAKFLVDNFGGTLVSSTTTGAVPMFTLQVGGQQVLISSSPADEAVNGDTTQSRHGLDHWGLCVADLDAAYEELKAKGVEFTVPPRRAGSNMRIAFLLIPENMRIELTEYSNEG